ncbi:MAG TPA: aldo/keto reductase [Allosphingosinicella sp.]|jgi:aryl-alcohol dehydrogenase-like predicted oxidoreductase
MSGAAARLGLGTVQFGLAYGITNKEGQVPEPEVRAILELCEARGIDTLDTAHLYGTSEDAIGRNTPAAASFKIVTKTPKFAEVTSAAAAESLLRSAFAQSLQKLRQPQVYGLLFHDAEDLLGANGEALWEACESLRGEGLVTKIGLSVYSGEQIDQALQRFPISLIQVPYNPLDTRLVHGGQLARLAAAGVEVHARSLFLQGLLLQPVSQVPARFGPLVEAVAELDSFCRQAGMTRLAGVMALALSRPEISKFICGVTRTSELSQIVEAAQIAAKGLHGLTFDPPPIPPHLLNPATWTQTG